MVKRTALHPLAMIDLTSGKAEIDNLEGTWADPEPRNVLEKV